VIYRPDLSVGITESFFQHMEKLAPRNNAAMLIKKRITEISIELFQNIQRHSIDMQSSYLTIEKTEACYSIKAMNRVHAKDIHSLANRLQTINTLNHSDLKRAYKQTLRQAALSEKGGAGLGLYRIALRSANQFVYAFQKIDTYIFSFSLEIKLAHV
jgi:Family of unknown function (DUF6272)